MMLETVEVSAGGARGEEIVVYTGGRRRVLRGATLRTLPASSSRGEPLWHKLIAGLPMALAVYGLPRAVVAMKGDAEASGRFTESHARSGAARQLRSRADGPA